MSPFLQQFADRAVESLIAPGAGSWQVGVDHPACHCVQNGRGRLPVLYQRHGNTQAGRGRAASRDHQHPLGGRLDAAGLGEELRGGHRGHRRGGHHHRHRAVSGPQLPEAAEGPSGGGFADDQVIVLVPAAQRAIERLEAARIVVDRHQRRNCHRLLLYVHLALAAGGCGRAGRSVDPDARRGDAKGGRVLRTQLLRGHADACDPRAVLRLRLPTGGHRGDPGDTLGPQALGEGGRRLRAQVQHAASLMGQPARELSPGHVSGPRVSDSAPLRPPARRPVWSRPG